MYLLHGKIKKAFFHAHHKHSLEHSDSVRNVRAVARFLCLGGGGGGGAVPDPEKFFELEARRRTFLVFWGVRVWLKMHFPRFQLGKTG